MADQLKQALIDAGLVTKDKLKELEREKVRKRHVKSGRKMREDHLRIVCEVCNKSAPDVERYAHKNRMLEGKQWLCLMCADQYQILDDCRISHQSSQAKQGMFIRQYGPTKKF